MKSYLQVVLVVAAVTGSRGQAASCPEKCSCESFHSMYCNGRGVTQPPLGYWPLINNLYMSHNNISQLFSFSLTGFPSVVRLTLNDNALTVVDLRIFVATPRITYLYLGNNLIHTVTWSAGSQFTLGNLNHIFLEKNNIATLDPDLFAKASPNLYQLHLSDNPLVVQDGRPVLNHPRLAWVFLNGVRRLPGGAGSFCGLPRAERLFLTKSGVSEVRAGAFCATSLNVLSLSNNPLRRFDVAAVNNVMHRGFIDVHDTPLACACAYDALYWWGVANNVSVAALCAGGSDCNIPKI